jgi:hypothetical protein
LIESYEAEAEVIDSRLTVEVERDPAKRRKLNREGRTRSNAAAWPSAYATGKCLPLRVAMLNLSFPPDPSPLGAWIGGPSSVALASCTRQSWVGVTAIGQT